MKTMEWWYNQPRRSVADLRESAHQQLHKLRRKNANVSPVVVEGRKIAKTFWGKAWCKNLESYADMAYRLPRGRSYLCNGCVVDLRIEPGVVEAKVVGSELYATKVRIAPLEAKAWAGVKKRCGGQIGSLVELLQGKLSDSVMAVVTHPKTGLFPQPSEIKMDCSCPDYADVCKHVAAVLYGIGARLDTQPELLFKLRGVDHMELINAAGEITAGTKRGKAKRLAVQDLGDVFGIEIDEPRRRNKRAKRSKK